MKNFLKNLGGSNPIGWDMEFNSMFPATLKESTPIRREGGGTMLQPALRQAVMDAAHNEEAKLNKFMIKRSEVNWAHQQDLIAISKIAGHTAIPAPKKIMGPDPLGLKKMVQFEGQEWPSLTRDFGVTHLTDPKSGHIIKEGEFKIKYDEEIKDYFSSLDKHAESFKKLGVDGDLFDDALTDMMVCESRLFNETHNPPPRDRLGRKKDENIFQLERLAEKNYLRFHYEYNFNKMADATDTYLHIRFEDVEKHNNYNFDQYLIFTFPQSDAERQIWQHVFWEKPEPAEGYNNTPERQFLAKYHSQSGQIQEDALNEVTSALNAMQVGGQSTPPAYDSATNVANPRQNNP